MHKKLWRATVSALAVALALGVYAPSVGAHGFGHGGGGFHGGGFVMVRPVLPFRPAPTVYYRPAPTIQYAPVPAYTPPPPSYPVPSYAGPPVQPTYTPPPETETEPAPPPIVRHHVRRAYHPSPSTADGSSATRPPNNRESGSTVARLLVLAGLAAMIWAAWRSYKFNGGKFPFGHSKPAPSFSGTPSGPSPVSYYIPE